jgi:mono/diheme cytochrome c family protein
MNFPVWDVTFGAGLLIALVAILHVFVSHFAVGGGLFLVLTERRARRSGDQPLLGWLKFHTKFFVLVTVVFGAVSGVGIWFTIGLINPTATSNLIHAFVWGWGIEWVFFFIEITAALLYLYGWDKLDPKLHEWYGWIYFGAAYASLVIINGIITFMLTPGAWVTNHRFWSGFFNPTYFPSLATRTLICLALAGVYALITASVQKDRALRARIVRWSAWWIVPSLALMPAAIWWYILRVPADLWTSARGAIPVATHAVMLGGILFLVLLALAVFALLQPRRMHLAFALVVAIVALGAMGSFEFVREGIRKPYTIANYLYDNSVYAKAMPRDGGFNVDQIDQQGVLNTAKWIDVRKLDPADQVAVGHEIFRVECQSCHTTNAYRGLKKLITFRHWDQNEIQLMLGRLNLMHNGVMPPFSGTDDERAALAAYLSTVAPVVPSQAAGPLDGHAVFVRNCAVCHRVRPQDPLFLYLPKDPQTAVDALKSLPMLFPLMPDLKLSEEERIALVDWVNTQRGVAGAGAGGAKGGAQ